MYDYMPIGPVPALEDCEQLGPDYDEGKARAECRRFIAGIRRVLGPEPDGAMLVVKSNAHDFGTYLEVNIKYDENTPEAVDYAFRVEADAPQTWKEAGV